MRSSESGRRGGHTLSRPRQEQHVRGCAPLPVALMLLDRMLGCLLGGAIGDAFGYEVELGPGLKIKKRYGGRESRNRSITRKIRVSNDTQMTLLSWKNRPVESKRSEEQEHSRWRRTSGSHISTGSTRKKNSIRGGSRSARSQKTRGCGGGRLRETCLAALRAGGRGSPEKPINDSKGCGGVMRVAPLGLLQKWRPTEAAELAARAAALTHGHPSGYLSAAAMAAIVRLTLDAVDPEDAARRAKGIVSHWKDVQETTGKIDAALKAAQRRDGEPRDKPQRARQRMGWRGGSQHRTVQRSYRPILSGSAVNRSEPRRRQRLDRLDCGTIVRGVEGSGRFAERVGKEA